MVTTTRRLHELAAQCDDLGIPYPPNPSREVLMDLLRERLGVFDKDLEVDPMKARDLNNVIDWADIQGSIGSWLGPGFTMQPKLDGVRLRLFMGKAANSMNSGRRSVKTFAYVRRDDNFPLLRDAVVPELAGTVLDGELLAPSSRLQTHTGNWTDSLLNASVALTNSNPVDSVRTQRRYGWCTFHVFDVLYVNGESVMGEPFLNRYAYVRKIVNAIKRRYPDCPIGLVPNWPSTPESLLRSLEEGYEGVVIKLDRSTYAPGQRNGGGPPRGGGSRPTAGWAKVKQTATIDACVCGFNEGERGTANEGLVGSLNLAVYRPASPVEAHSGGTVDIGGVPHVEQPVAQVGNLREDWRRAISQRGPGGMVLLDPDVYGTVIEFKAQALGKNMRARHAGMLRLRPDKAATECLASDLEAFSRA
jgi:ATP-dependent DNA ligase